LGIAFKWRGDGDNLVIFDYNDYHVAYQWPFLGFRIALDASDTPTGQKIPSYEKNISHPPKSDPYPQSTGH
jgi:hypothetical protein